MDKDTIREAAEEIRDYFSGGIAPGDVDYVEGCIRVAVKQEQDAIITASKKETSDEES